MLMSSVIFFVVLGAALGLALGYAAVIFHVESDPLVDQIENLLPGGQCGQCGEAGCRQAAEKMAAGELGPDCCPPGGAVTRSNIANLLGVTLEANEDEKQWVARIDETQCSGCNRCYKACPFDAIVGAPKQMHTVVKDVCTGCKLCGESCSQHALSFVEVVPDSASWYWPKPKQTAAA